MANPPPFSTGEWSLDYIDGEPGICRIKAGDRCIVEFSPQENPVESTANAHLLAAAPLLYKALQELLLATEEALMEKNIGCECLRCENAKQAAYQALGFAEGKNTLKEGNRQ